MSELPPQWSGTSLGELCKIRTGDKDVNEGNPSGPYPFFTCSRKVYRSDSYSFDTEALLIAGNGEVGALQYYKGKFEAYQRTYVLDDFKANIHYLRHYIRANLGRRLESQHIGSVIPFIKYGDLDKFVIQIPTSTFEQEKIAQILDTLDTQIRQTEALIAKLERIKQGLLTDLLTRGIDQNGQLRPTPDQAPHLYKDSPLGWIPSEWEVTPLGGLSEIVSGVTLGGASPGISARIVPYLRVANVQDGFLDLSEVKYIRVTSTNAEKFRLEYGDVLMNEGGDFDKLGRGTIWRNEIPECIHQNHVFRVRPDRALLLPDFLAAYSASTGGKNYFLLSSKQSTNLASINSTQLKAFPIPLPPASEQRSIVAVLSDITQRIDSEKYTLDKLSKQKSGLMDDLLTGRVRVTPLLEAKERATA